MNRDEILKACCSDHPTRYSLENPFIKGKFVCATNGHILVRTPVWDGCTHVADTDKTPPTEKVWREPTGSPIALPVIDYEPDMINCVKCFGSGECSCNCGDEHECAACEGTGQEPSEQELTPLDVGELTFTHVYIRLLRKIGVTEVYPTGDKMLHPAFFRVGECEGVVMQCLNEKRGDTMTGGRGDKAVPS